MSDRDDDANGEWVTFCEAARLLDVHRSNVPKMVRRGDLTPRKGRRPSLRLADVLELAEAREEAARLRALPPQPKVPKTPVVPLPPDNDEEWVQVDVVAAFLKVQPAAVRQRTRRGRLPHVVGADGHVWYQLDQVAMTVHAQEISRGLKCKCPAEWAAPPAEVTSG